MNAQPFTTGYTRPTQPVYELSGWWRRAGAWLIDSLLVFVAASIVAAALAVDGGIVFNDVTNKISIDSGDLALSTLINLLVATAVFAGVMAYNNGQTVGMMATSIRVVREGGENVDFKFAFYREIVVQQLLFGFFGIFTLYIATLLNYLWPLWDEKNQALHDKICHTRVVREKHLLPAEPYVGTAPQPFAPPVGPPPAPIPPAIPPPAAQTPPGFENPVPDDKR